MNHFGCQAMPCGKREREKSKKFWKWQNATADVEWCIIQCALMVWYSERDSNNAENARNVRNMHKNAFTVYVEDNWEE
jgi:hypothetical protein